MKKIKNKFIKKPFGIFENGGTINGSRRFTESDFNKLKKDFKVHRQEHIWAINEDDGVKFIAKWDADRDLLFVMGKVDSSHPIVKWLQENDYVNKTEVVKLANGGEANEDFKRIMKKEGDEHVVFLNPSIISDLEYFKPYKDDKELRKKVDVYMMANFKDVKIVNEHTKHTIVITSVAINKLTHNSGESKLRLLLHLPEIIANATPLRIEGITKFNHPIKRVAKFVYLFESYVRIGNETYEFGFSTFVVDENESYVYSGFLNIKKPV